MEKWQDKFVEFGVFRWAYKTVNVFFYCDLSGMGAPTAIIYIVLK